MSFVYHIVHLTIWHQLFLIAEYWLVDTWFFAHPRDQRAVTRLENVHQFNKKRGKKLGFELSHRQPLIGVFAGIQYNRAWIIHSTFSEALERLLMSRFIWERNITFSDKIKEYFAERNWWQ